MSTTMYLAVSLVLFAVTVFGGAAQQVPLSGERGSGKIDTPVALDAVISPLEITGPWFIENFSTELYLEHSVGPDGETGLPILAVSSVASGGDRVQWYINASESPSGIEATMHPHQTGELAVSATATSGVPATIETVATTFNFNLTKPYTYRITIPLTTLALTAPATSGSPVTFEEVEEGALSQSWHVYN